MHLYIIIANWKNLEAVKLFTKNKTLACDVQNCALGHYRSRSTPYLGICVRCNCNGHTNECDPVTGKCFVSILLIC